MIIDVHSHLGYDLVFNEVITEEELGPMRTMRMEWTSALCSHDRRAHARAAAEDPR